MPLNDIFQKQNTSAYIEMFRAQGRIYDLAKNYANWIVLFSVIVVFIFTIFKIIFPELQWLKTISITYGIFSSVLCLVLEWLRVGKKKEAACIQQYIDCALFDIPWWPNWGNKPALEDIQEAASNEKPDRYYNWYDESIQNVSKQAATLICFRINVMYDRKLRSKYVCVCHILFIISVFIIVVLCLLFKLSFQDFLCYALAPAMPIILMYFKTILTEKNDTTNLESIRTKLVNMECKLKAGEAISPQDMQLIQDSIYEHRKNSFCIPSFFYNRYRTKNEESMHQFASRMAENLAGF